ncbi:hypothetical protein NBT14_08430 [Weissella paramesenteroides]|uniref:hypothetical protein n=1 Tax=Weissella paramesenteroides TaxID=1249 RepID=UPI00240296B7|nr:hypothetical protein [Weissella paramesenteroides]MDF8366411.1 hypothetical protein [Weissella paramesenteroides]
MDQVLELSFLTPGQQTTDTNKKLSVIKIKHPATTLDRDAVYQAMLKLVDFEFLLNNKGEPMTLGRPYMATMVATNKKIIFDKSQKMI